MPGKSIPVRILIASTLSLHDDSSEVITGAVAPQRNPCHCSRWIIMHAGFLVAKGTRDLDAMPSGSAQVLSMGEQ